MTKTHNTKVLVVATSEFEKLGKFKGFHYKVGKKELDSFLLPGEDGKTKAFFHDRDEAEKDQTMKQIIPYFILVSDGKVLTYTRGKEGGEDRLHDQLSIGIGGHIEDTDDTEPFFAYANGAKREIKEEVGIELNHDELQKTISGFVYNPNDPVGLVHMGVVHIISLNPTEASVVMLNCESSMVDPKWVEITDFMQDDNLYTSLEGWSRFVMAWMCHNIDMETKKSDPAWRERLISFGGLASQAAMRTFELLGYEDNKEYEDYKENLETAIGEMLAMFSGMKVNRDVSTAIVKAAYEEFLEALPELLTHQNWTKTNEPPNPD